MAEFIRRISTWRSTAAALAIGAVALTSCGLPESEGADVSTRDLPAATTSTERTTTTERATTTSKAPKATTTTSTIAPGIPEGRRTTVTRVVDGDTIEVDGGEKVRLIGINTPETKDPRKGVECFGHEASAAAEELMPPGTEVVLETDVEATDRYGRTLAYVHRIPDGLFVNHDLVARGFAEVATYPPNVRHTDTFIAAQREAREAGRGLWSACGGTEEAAAAPPATTPPAPAPAPEPAPAPAPAPPPPTPAPAPAPAGGGCHPSYPTLCLPGSPDLNCADVPAKNFPVLPPDPHRLDGDKDGIGCES